MRNFRRRVQRVADRQLRKGRLTPVEYKRVQDALRDPVLMKKWEAEVERQLVPKTESRESRIDWLAIRQWFIDNWPTILRILLSLLVLLDTSQVEASVEDNKSDDVESDYTESDSYFSDDSNQPDTLTEE